MPRHAYQTPRDEPTLAHEPRLKGAVVRLIRDKGFGFIRAGSEGLEYFFHKSCLTDEYAWDSLSEGQPVTFVSRPGQKGPRAEDVQLTP